MDSKTEKIVGGIILLVLLVLVSAVFFLGAPKSPTGEKSVPVCGNGIVEAGEDCGSCPQDFPKEECACFSPEKVIHPPLKQTFYFCRGQEFSLEGYTISLQNITKLPQIEIIDPNGNKQVKSLETTRETLVGPFSIYFEKTINNGVKISIKKQGEMEVKAKFYVIPTGWQVSFRAVESYVKKTNTSTNEEEYIYGDEGLNFAWDFDVEKDAKGDCQGCGDGIPDNDVESTELSPSHLYINGGLFQVKLTVTSKENPELHDSVIKEINASEEADGIPKVYIAYPTDGKEYPSVEKVEFIVHDSDSEIINCTHYLERAGEEPQPKTEEITSGSKKTVEFDSLEPGNYTYFVVCTDEEGNTGAEITVFTVA